MGPSFRFARLACAAGMIIASLRGESTTTTVNLTIQFAADATVGWIDTVELRDESGVTKKSVVAAPNSPAHTVRATLNNVATGHVYTVFAVASGLKRNDVGQLDLSTAPPEATLTLPAHGKVAAAAPTTDSSPTKPNAPTTSASIAGTYRAWSFNVDGAGGRPPTGSPALILNADGTYRFSSERGTFVVRGDQIELSASKIRGPGKIVDGNKIVFDYVHDGHHTVATYLKQ